MSNLEKREDRRKTKSVIGDIISSEPKIMRGRPKEDRELKKRISLSILPSLYEDIQKIAFVQRRSISELIASLLEAYRSDHQEELIEHDNLRKK